MKWDSAKGPHSCSFDVEWLKEFDYSTPDVLKEKAQDLAPIVTVRHIDLLYIRAAIHHTSQHQRARCPARPLWPHLWLAKKSIAMAEYSGSSYYNSLKSGETSVQWLFSY